MPGKRTKRFLRCVLWFVIILVLLAISIPLWFPWVLRPVAKRFGATFGKYERLGYSQFAVTGVAYTNRNVRVEAGRLEVAPLRGRATARDWAVIVTPSGGPSTNAPASVHSTYQQVSRIVRAVQRRIPEAALTNGYVQAPKVTVQIPGVRWSGPDLSGQAQISNALPLTAIQAKIPQHGPVHIDLEATALNLKSRLAVSNAPDALFIQADNRWRTNDFNATVKFATNGTLPETATITAKTVMFPPVKGDVLFVWNRDRYALDLEGAVPHEDLAFKAHVVGDIEHARIDSAEIIAPWAFGKLERPVELRYQRPYVITDGLFTVTADLAEQRLIPVQGKLAGEVSVSASNLAHSGSIMVQNFSAPRIDPFDLALGWSGEALNLTDVQATAVAGHSTVSMRGAADLKEKLFRVTQLALGTNQIDLAGNVRWPASGTLCMHATNLSAEALSGFVDLPYQQTVLDHLYLAAGWTNGPLVGGIDFVGHTLRKDGTRLGARAEVATHAKGLSITNLTFTRNGEPVGGAYGIVPILVNPTNKPFVTPLRSEPVQLQVTAHPKAFFWKSLEREFGVSLRELDVRGELSGTWDKPQGRLSARAAEIKLQEGKAEVPPLDSLSLVAHIREDAAEIEFLNFFVTNQPVTFSALMPLPKNFWSAPRTNITKLDWRNLTCRARIDSAQIAAFAALLPSVLAPQGIIDADLGLVPGGKLDGQLRIDGAATRSIGTIGTLQDIEILCRVAGDTAQINAHVTLGGHSVFGVGKTQIDLNPDRIKTQLPPFEFHITGENIPLTRQPDAIVRADLDVTVKHESAQPVMLAGDLHLRDSLYLRELRDLVPGRLASVDRRPPYFSVEAKPFADWRLDLNAAGQRFLKVRTPIFNGEVSADLKLSGTLANPVAIGDVTINAGLVRFPFGTIPVGQGIVSLTSDNPFRPRLLITGNDRVLGYEINMELAGYADAPVLQFSSTPPLSSDQVLLMLTAGEIPRQGQLAFTTEQRAQRVALFIGSGVLSGLGIGGDSNRLTIRSGEHITETGRPTYSVEYELTENWSVIGQYDRFNDFNLMLKWRVYAR